MNWNCLLLVIFTFHTHRVGTNKRPKSSAASDNFYTEKKLTGGNMIEATVAFDISVYKPSCGWKALLTSDVVLTDIEGWDFTWDKVNDYQYVFGNKSYNGTPKKGWTSDLDLHGSFGSVSPEVTIYWSCVCNATTDEVCVPVQRPGQSSTTTPTHPPAIADVSTRETPSAFSSHNTMSYPSESESASTTTISDVPTATTSRETEAPPPTSESASITTTTTSDVPTTTTSKETEAPRSTSESVSSTTTTTSDEPTATTSRETEAPPSTFPPPLARNTTRAMEATSTTNTPTHTHSDTLTTTETSTDSSGSQAITAAPPTMLTLNTETPQTPMIAGTTAAIETTLNFSTSTSPISLPATVSTGSSSQISTGASSPQIYSSAGIPPTSSDTGFSIFYLIKQFDECYFGRSQSTMTNIQNLIRCGAMCLETETCVAINFRKAMAECDIIYDHSGPTGIEENCQYYKVER